MKSVIKILNMDSSRDANSIQDAVSKNNGVIASEVSLSKKEITVIYNEIFLNIDNIIDCIEDMGYLVV